MQPRDWKVRIEDILDSVAAIQDYIGETALEDFVADRRTVQEVERNYEIIGEAARYVPPEVQTRYPQVPWARMRGMRNLVAHQYSAVVPAVLWETARGDLPGLVPLLREILEKEP